MSDSNLLETLRADTELDHNVQFPLPLSSSWRKPKNILLTGATGFLGAYLLFELLQQTSANIICLVRADNDSEAANRLQQQLEKYQLWQANHESRIIAMAGDLSESYFGLTEDEFKQLAIKVDIIYHNGAQVNATSSYSHLRGSNVEGTKTVLRLAGSQHTKPVHFISTLAVFFIDENANKNILETDIPQIDETMKGGYKQSKWVAEALIRSAQTRGLPAAIYRPGRIWGDSKTVIMRRFSDLLCNLIQGGLHLGSYPEVDAEINIAPVDYVSKAIVALSAQKDCLNKAFHLNNPEPLHWNALWEIIILSGYPLTKLSLPEWKDSILKKSREKQQKQLYLVLRHLLRSPIYLFSQKPAFDTGNVKQYLPKGELSCPTFDKKLLQNYLNAFQKNSYIPAPPSSINLEF